MEIPVTKMVPVTKLEPITKLTQVRFKSKGRYPLPNGERSMHDWGEIVNAETGEHIGSAVKTKTKYFDYSFAVNVKEFDHATREGSTIKYICFESYTGKEYIVTVERAKAVNPRILTSEKYPDKPFYVFIVTSLVDDPEEELLF